MYVESCFTLHCDTLHLQALQAIACRLFRNKFTSTMNADSIDFASIESFSFKGQITDVRIETILFFPLFFKWLLFFIHASCTSPYAKSPHAPHRHDGGTVERSSWCRFDLLILVWIGSLTKSTRERTCSHLVVELSEQCMNCTWLLASYIFVWLFNHQFSRFNTRHQQLSLREMWITKACCNCYHLHTPKCRHKMIRHVQMLQAGSCFLLLF